MVHPIVGPHFIFITLEKDNSQGITKADMSGLLALSGQLDSTLYGTYTRSYIASMSDVSL